MAATDALAAEATDYVIAKLRTYAGTEYTQKQIDAVDAEQKASGRPKLPPIKPHKLDFVVEKIGEDALRERGIGKGMYLITGKIASVGWENPENAFRAQILDSFADGMAHAIARLGGPPSVDVAPMTATRGEKTLEYIGTGDVRDVPVPAYPGPFDEKLWREVADNDMVTLRMYWMA